MAFHLRWKGLGAALNWDEKTYAVAGWGLLQGKLTTFHMSWQVPDFPRRLMHPWSPEIPFIADRPDLLMLEPWFSQPYLGIAFIALSEYLFGFTPMAVRLPFILASSLSVAGTFIVLRKIHNDLSALIAAAFLAFSPTIVGHGFVAFLDNFVAFFSILVLYAVARYLDERRERYLYLASIFAGLSALCKVPGLFLLVFLIFFTLYDSRRRGEGRRIVLGRLMRVGAIGLSIFMIYPVMGLAMDWSAYLSYVAFPAYGRAAREGAHLLFITLETLIAGGREPYDILFAMFCLASVGSRHFKKWDETSVISVLGVISFFLFLLPVSGHMFWHFIIAIYPLLAIVFGYTMAESIRRTMPIANILFAIFLGISGPAILLTEFTSFGKNYLLFRLGIFAPFVLLNVLHLVQPSQRIEKVLSWFLKVYLALVLLSFAYQGLMT